MSRQFCLVFSLAVFAFLSGKSDALYGQGEFATRPLAPGVLKVVPPNIEVESGVIRPALLPGLKVQNYQPKTVPAATTLRGLISNRIRYRDIWQLEFSYKPLRYITVDIPRPGGKAKKTRIWYLLYRVRNLNEHLSFPENDKGQRVPNTKTPLANLNPNDMPCRFFPSMRLEGWVQNPDGKFVLKSYRDQVLPEAIKAIKKEEKITGELLDGFAIGKKPVPAAVGNNDGVWGVATWADADPRINFVFVSVQGLTNSYIQDSAATGGKRRIKTLQLNFWRPGDASFENDRFHNGIQYNDRLERQILVCKRYKLPGPSLVISKQSPKTKSVIPYGSVSGEYDLSTLKSKVVDSLDQGEMPANLADGLKRRGVASADDLQVEVVAKGRKWKLSGPTPDQQFFVELNPISWKVNGEDIEFVGPLENFWHYRYIY